MGKKIQDDRHRINVTFDIDTYNQIKAIADKNNKTTSDIVRSWAMQGLNGTLTKDNVDILVPIIREQLSSIINPAIERLATLSAKACVQSGAAAYLSAEAINRFVQPSEREEVARVYEAARKKSVLYIKGKENLD